MEQGVGKVGLGELGRRVVLGRWFVVFVSFFIMSCSGGTYIFGVYSETIKTYLGYDQSTIATLGFFKDLGANVGIVSGLINEVFPSWVVLAVGSFMNIAGYLMIWLAVTQKIATPHKWQMYLYMCLGANSQTFANTGALVTCVKNFPQSRGVVLGILKGFVGLSGAIFTQIYHAVYGEGKSHSGAAGMIMLLGILPSVVSLAVMFFIRPTKIVTDKKELKRFYHFLYIALALAGFLLVMIVAENQVKNFSRAWYRVVVAAIVVLILLNLAIVVKAEMDSLIQEKLSNKQQVEIVVSPPPTSAIIGQPPVNKPDSNEKNPTKCVGIWSWFCKTFKCPERGEDYTIPQALVSVDMWILFISTTFGIGATLTAIDNMGQIGKALGYTPQNITTFIALISIWNFLGRVTSGYLSEILLHKYKFPRPLMMTVVLLISCVGHILIAFPVPGSLYVASVIIGVCFGAQWPVMYAVISELFGLKYYATLYNFGAVSSPLGSYLFSVKVAGYLYDKEALRQMPSQAGKSAKELTCSGRKCFHLTFVIMTGVTLFAALISVILVFRTREFYRSDIYAKFKDDGLHSQEEQEHSNDTDKKLHM